MSSPLSDTYPVAGYMSQLSHTSIPPLQQNDDNMLPALRGGTDCLTLTLFSPRRPPRTRPAPRRITTEDQAPDRDPDRDRPRDPGPVQGLPRARCRRVRCRRDPLRDTGRDRHPDGDRLRRHRRQDTTDITDITDTTAIAGIPDGSAGDWGSECSSARC